MRTDIHRKRRRLCFMQNVCNADEQLVRLCPCLGVDLLCRQHQLSDKRSNNSICWAALGALWKLDSSQRWAVCT